MGESWRTLIVGLLLSVAGCAPLQAPGMSASGAPKVAMAPRAPRTPTGQTLFVAFPESACTSTESAVFLDEQGRFVGSVVPGTAAAMPLPPGSKKVLMVGSLDVLAPPQTWFVRHEVLTRPDEAVIVEIGEADEHNCKGKWSGPLSPRPRVATLDATLQAAEGLSRLDVRQAEGNAWLEEHRDRVDELVGKDRVPPPTANPIVTEAWQAP